MLDHKQGFQSDNLVTSMVRVVTVTLLIVVAVLVLTTSSVEADTWIKDIPIGTSPCGIAINAVTNQIFVGSAGSDSVSIIDGQTDTVSHTVTLPSALFSGCSLQDYEPFAIDQADDGGAH
jgi:YVTN family beta-propeller protein